MISRASSKRALRKPTSKSVRPFSPMRNKASVSVATVSLRRLASSRAVAISSASALSDATPARNGSSVCFSASASSGTKRRMASTSPFALATSILSRKSLTDGICVAVFTNGWNFCNSVSAFSTRFKFARMFCSCSVVVASTSCCCVFFSVVCNFVLAAL